METVLLLDVSFIKIPEVMPMFFTENQKKQMAYKSSIAVGRMFSVSTATSDNKTQ